MTFDMNPADDDPHLDCKREVNRLESELAAMSVPPIRKAPYRLSVEVLEALLLRGWSITGIVSAGLIEYRGPDGISGSDFQTDDLSVFPKGVRTWILNKMTSDNT